MTASVQKHNHAASRPSFQTCPRGGTRRQKLSEAITGVLAWFLETGQVGQRQEEKATCLHCLTLGCPPGTFRLVGAGVGVLVLGCWDVGMPLGKSQGQSLAGRGR